MSGEEADALDDAFEAAAAFVAATSSTLRSDVLLALYGCYKQATSGPCDAVRPSILDRRGRAKWSAWNELGNMSSSAAKATYVDKLSQSVPGWAGDTPADGASGLPQGQPAGPVFSTLAHTADASTEPQLEVETLHTASAAGNASTVARLLAAGSDPNQLDVEGLSALHWAADRGHAEVVQLLVHKGADADLQDPDGQTPLHYAAICEHKEVYACLLQLGAKSCVSNATGERPGDIAPKQWS